MKYRKRDRSGRIFIVFEAEKLVQAGEGGGNRRRNAGPEMMRRTAGHRAVGFGGCFAIIVGVQFDAGSNEKQQNQQAKSFKRFPHGRAQG